MAWCRCADDVAMSRSMHLGRRGCVDTAAHTTEAKPAALHRTESCGVLIRAGRVKAVGSMARRPAGASSAPRTWSSRSLDSLDRPAASARQRGRDHDQDRRDNDADNPPDPVNAARRLNTERCGEVVADEHAPDPADNGEPERNVVAVAWREELAQQADDDACDDHTDDVHRRPLSPVGDGLAP